MHKSILTVAAVALTAASAMAVTNAVPLSGADAPKAGITPAKTYHLILDAILGSNGFVTASETAGVVTVGLAPSGAVNGSTVTNLNASNLASGTVPTNRLPASVQALAGANGSALTNLNASNLASGTVPAARLASSLQALELNNGAALTNVPAAALVGGWSGAVTNASTLITNVVYYNRGIVTNVVSTLP